jgi:hypothetical protein
MSEQSLTLDPKEVPAEIDRWNWGAFLLNWIWGVGNNTYIALLVLVPFVGLIMIFVLGAKGSRWAWRNGRWDSVEHFQRVQRAWAIWAVVIYIGAAALFAALFGSAFYFLSHSEAYRLGEARLQASVEAANLLGAPITTGIPMGSVSTTNADGKATLSFSVSGPKGTGRAFLEATKKNGIWSLDSLKFKVDGQDGVIDLVNPARAAIGGDRWRADLRTSAPS